MSKLGKPVSQRQLRVGEMIKQALGMIFLRDEAKLPNLETREITVTEVRMSQDLKIAKAFVLPLGGKNAQEIVGKLKELTKMAERGDFEQIQRLLDRDVMQIMMKAIVDTKAELQATRKRGGPKSRGINKESILDVIGRSEIKELDLKEFTLTDVKDMVKKGWMARPTEKQWKELIKIYNKYKGNVTRKDLIDLGIASIGRKESVEEAGGVGRVVPGVNISVDVGPNEIKKQAAKFGNAVDKDGVPKKNLR